MRQRHTGITQLDRLTYHRPTLRSRGRRGHQAGASLRGSPRRCHIVDPFATCAQRKSKRCWLPAPAPPGIRPVGDGCVADNLDVRAGVVGHWARVCSMVRPDEVSQNIPEYCFCKLSIGIPQCSGRLPLQRSCDLSVIICVSCSTQCLQSTSGMVTSTLNMSLLRQPSSSCGMWSSRTCWLKQSLIIVGARTNPSNVRGPVSRCPVKCRAFLKARQRRTSSPIRPRSRQCGRASLVGARKTTADHRCYRAHNALLCPTVCVPAWQIVSWKCTVTVCPPRSSVCGFPAATPPHGD